MTTVRPVMAATTYPNTPESDMQRRVSHTVEGKGTDGNWYEMRIYAEDPMDALEKARRIPEASLWNVKS